MKSKRTIAKIAIAACCMIASMTATALSIEPVEASAVFHWDFWNWETNCTVVYQQIGYSYKVIVTSSDCKHVWRNDVASVPYWYPSNLLQYMIGYAPGYSGAATVDIQKDVLNNPSYFAAYVYY